MKKVMFIASTGGHLSELMQLKRIFKNYDYEIVTEKTESTKDLEKTFGDKIKFVPFGNKHHLFRYLLTIPVNIVLYLKYFFTFKPDVVITTGAHTCVFMCYLAKLFHKKVIYIETFANIYTKTLSGRLVYPIADAFIVQWESMLELYPNAIYGGWIY